MLYRLKQLKKKTSFQQWQLNDNYISLRKFTDITHYKKKFGEEKMNVLFGLWNHTHIKKKNPDTF